MVSRVLFLLVPLAIAVTPCAVSAPAAGRISYDRAISKYVRFLQRQRRTSAEYILDLFNRYDLVVLCERAHPEVTQYDMIYAVVSDPRFQEMSGHIFTEVGGASLRPFVESFLMDGQLSEEQIKQKLRYIALHIGWDNVWDKTNFYDFLKKLYYLNRSLPKDRRVHLYPSDLDFQWENATRERWTEFETTQLSRRDEIMADNVISKYNEIKQGSRRKALVIMNYRHAFPHIKGQWGAIENTHGFLMTAYPGKLANVMINHVAFLQGSTDQTAVITAIQEGKWDAAFAVRGNPDLGFDFRGSPFGEDGFDYWPFPTGLRYRDVFTGFVFYQPLEAHRMSFGLPGLFDQSFLAEVLKRYQDTGQNYDLEWLNDLGTLRIFDWDGISRSDYAEKIQQWLRTR